MKIDKFKIAPSLELDEILNKPNEANVKLSAIGSGNLTSHWIDITGTCEILKVSSRTLQSYRDESKIGFSQIGSKIWFKFEEIESFRDRHYVSAIY